MGFWQAEKGLAVETNQEMLDVPLQVTSKFDGDAEAVAVVPGSTFADQQDMRRLYVSKFPGTCVQHASRGRSDVFRRSL